MNNSVTRLLKEPLVQFLIIGAGIYGAYVLFAPPGKRPGFHRAGRSEPETLQAGDRFMLPNYFESRPLNWKCASAWVEALLSR